MGTIPSNNEKKIEVKFNQAIKSVEDLIKQLEDPSKRTFKFPESWGDNAFWNNSLKIKKSAWTNTGSKFTNFVRDSGITLTGGVSCNHNNNPSDVLLVVQNSGKEKLLGISLKATFGKTDIGMYNGGIPAFLYVIVEKNNLSSKDTGVKTKRLKDAANAVSKPYDKDFNQYCKTNITGWSGNKANKKKVWKREVGEKDNIKDEGKVINAEKLNALSLVRDNLVDQIIINWGLKKDLTGSISNTELEKAIGGMFQFTHENITSGSCNVPYIKLTSLLLKNSSNLTKLTGNYKTDLDTSFKPPIVSKYLKGGNKTDDTEVKIIKSGAVSFYICTNGKPQFLVRVKCESVPPSAIKIDIVEVSNKKIKINMVGGSSSVAATKSRSSSSNSSIEISDFDEYITYLTRGHEISQDEYTILYNLWDDFFCDFDDDEDIDVEKRNACNPNDLTIEELNDKMLSNLNTYIESSIETIIPEKDKSMVSRVKQKIDKGATIETRAFKSLYSNLQKEFFNPIEQIKSKYFSTAGEKFGKKNKKGGRYRKKKKKSKKKSNFTKLISN